MNLRCAALATCVGGLMVLASCGREPAASGASGTTRPASQTTGGGRGAASTPAGGGRLAEIAQQRNLSPDDLVAAAMTYTPSGRHDEYIQFASGGHSGQVFAIGLPSMRILRSIAVFAPEPWQGYGYGAGNEILEQGRVAGREVLWGDTHHPALSETRGDYDGQFLFINDKANARVAVIDLRDWETKQIVANPLTLSDHGGTFVTPNTEYVVEGGQYATPLGQVYAPISEYQESYRGMVTFWKFDRAAGRIDQSKSFALELPPYWQDLFDAGKGPSEGWVFGNSINTEMASGGIESGNPPFEAGVSRRDMDYLHVINLQKAEELFRAGRFEEINGFPVIPIETLAEEGVLYFIPEPKSPHGVDVTPDGRFMVVSGKLDPHVTVYSFEKVQAAIASGQYERDPFGVAILDFDSCVEARVELGLGPLHTQFDAQGYAYTSLFLEPAVARWTIGGEMGARNPEPDWTLVGKTSVHYNIGHIAAAEGDTVSPDGGYLVAMNKWSLDRFFPTGPLLPQNFQLLDIAGAGEKFPVIYDMPMGIGEPHYAQIIRADKLKPWTVYPEVAWNPHENRVEVGAPSPGRERIERHGNEVHIYMTVVRSHFNPEHIEVNQGDKVVWHLTSTERAQDASHGFSLSAYNINLSLEPGEYSKVEFIADTAGTFPFYCSEFCSALHLEMMGYLLVKPSGQASAESPSTTP